MRILLVICLISSFENKNMNTTLVLYSSLSHIFLQRLLRFLPPAIACLLVVFNARAQAFQKIYTNPDSAFFLAYDLYSNTSQGFFITGAIQISRPQTFVMKTDLNGVPAWTKMITPVGANFSYITGEAVTQTSDNGAVLTIQKLAGVVESGGVLVKTNSSGNVSWAKLGSCLAGTSEVCASDNSIYYAAEGKSNGKVFLAKLSNSGQVLWQQWIDAGNTDNYTVEALVPTVNNEVVLGLSTIPNSGSSQGQIQTILLRIDGAGAVQQSALFPAARIAALAPLNDGRIAFRCSAADNSWTGMGLMSNQFNFNWFKKARYNLTPLLPNISGQELAVSEDQTQITGIFYTQGGEKSALAFDVNGNLIQEELYATNTLTQTAAAAPGRGYVRASGARTTSFTLTRSFDDGEVFANCFFPNPCVLILEDATLTPQAVTPQISTTDCLQDESAAADNLPVSYSDHCVDVGIVDATFRMSDTTICAGGTINFRRNSGAFEPVFGSSNWLFEGGSIPAATTPIVQNVRFNQPGSYSIRHIYTVAGCRDTAYLTVTVLGSFPLNLGPDTTVCNAAGLQLIASTIPGLTYKWNTGSTSSSLQVTETGTYTVTVTVPGGCVAQDAVNVRVLSQKDVDLGPDDIVCENASTRLKASMSTQSVPLTWSTGETGTFIDVTSPGTYIAELIAEDCYFTDTIVVSSANCGKCQVFAPNVFTPESMHGGNEFRFAAGCVVLASRLEIYDRWGSLLFQSSDLNAGWDGRYKGQLMPPGVYTYHALLQLQDDDQPVEWRQVDGNVLLVR